MNVLEFTNWDDITFTELDTLLRVNCLSDEQLLNKVLSNKLTPLCSACKHNREDLVTILLYHGANPNLRSGFLDKAPLHFACDHESGNIGIVRKLIEAKADLNAVDEDGNTGLHLACTESNRCVVRLLIESGADVNLQDIDGETPLIRACFARSLLLIELLLNSGSDPNISDGAALEIAVRAPLVDALKLLIQAGADVHQGALLSCACEHNNIDMMKILHEYGADVDKPNLLGMTPLQTSCYTQLASLTTMTLLLEWGAQVNASSKSRKTALHYACISQDLRKVHLLLAYGADVNLLDFYQLSPLMTTITNSSCPNNVIVNLLVAAGTVITIQRLDQIRSSVVHLVLFEEKGQQIIQDLYVFASRPKRLQDLCRVQIRNNIHPNIDEKIESLPLPRCVIRYLKFSDVVPFTF